MTHYVSRRLHNNGNINICLLKLCSRLVYDYVYDSLICRIPPVKWNESGFRPPLCTYRLNWARRTSWGWWDDTVLQTQDSKFEPWRSEAEHATSRSRRLPHNTDFHTWMGKKHFCFFQTAETGNRTPNSGVKGSGANHYPRAPARIPPVKVHYMLWSPPSWLASCDANDFRNFDI